MTRVVGGKIAITIDEDKYKKSLQQFRCCLIGRLVLMKGDMPIVEVVFDVGCC